MVGNTLKGSGGVSSSFLWGEKQKKRRKATKSLGASSFFEKKRNETSGSLKTSPQLAPQPGLEQFCLVAHSVRSVGGHVQVHLAFFFYTLLAAFLFDKFAFYYTLDIMIWNTVCSWEGNIQLAKRIDSCCQFWAEMFS